METVIKRLTKRIEVLEKRLEDSITVHTTNYMVLSARHTALVTILDLSPDQLLDLYNEAKEVGAELIKDQESGKFKIGSSGDG